MTHCDAVQLSVAFGSEQMRPQLPQLLTSFVVLTSQPSEGLMLQFVWPAAQMHMPPEQMVVATQSVLAPQPPPSGQAGHVPPPQSIPVSVPSWKPFEQLGWHWPAMQLSEQHWKLPEQPPPLATQPGVEVGVGVGVAGQVPSLGSSWQITSSTKASAVFSRLPVSLILRQPPENFASSLAKHPLAGLAPPSNLSFAFCRQAANFATSLPVGGFSCLA